MSFKRMLGLSVLAGLLASLALAIPAQASSSKGVVLALGDAKTADKIDPLLKGVRLVGGAGTYTFDALQLVSVGVAKGAPAVVVIDVKSEGYFHNIVCGTGKAVSVANTLVTIVADPFAVGATKINAIIQALDYAVEFVATKGIFYTNQAGTTKDLPVDLKPFDDPKPGDPSAGYDPTGVVSIDDSVTKTGGPAPKLGPNITDGNCTKAFHVAAVFAADSAV